MSLYRAFSQQQGNTTAATPQYPSNAPPILDIGLTTNSAVILPARTDNRRRGFILENDGTVPMVFDYGTTVSVAARTALLFPNDIWEDNLNWQGAVAAASVGGAGAVNLREVTII